MAGSHPVLVEIGVALAVLCVCLLVAGIVIRDAAADSTPEIVTDEKALEVRRERLAPHLEQVNAIPTPEGLRRTHDADVGECGYDSSDGRLVQAEAWFEWTATEPVAYDEVSRPAAVGYVEILDHLVEHGWRISERENLNGMVTAANPDFDSADLVHPSGVKIRTQFLGGVILGRLFFKGAPKVCSFA
ncbi:hypothetical protein G5C66_07940 [Nocardioides sp. KC13]|uniref:Uncharacterized protein n=1 Tax=Nocardioides turkmenicus TaxID=2711220 RepID=A0A6M1R8I4_9ACTN|nr:hypothetical protein [Nocardioides sp. KC13]NGN92667.1 hypothetical protein [Nocardioides sp. KC13]